MSASREAISRASIRTATSSPAGSRLPERDEASSASQSLLAPAAGAPARLAAFENLRQPAAEHPAAPPNSASIDTCQRLDGSTAPSSAGSASSRVARSLFFARVLADDANSRCDDRIRSEAVPSGSSGAGLRARGTPSAVRAITSASMASVFAMPGNIPRACFSAYPGR